MTRSTTQSVAVQGLQKSFGPVPALRDVSFTLPWGAVLSVFGANGAGKSTMLRTMATLVRPDSGTVRIAGMDGRREASGVRKVVGYLGHQPLLYDELTAEDNLRFYGRLYGIADARARAAEVLADVGMSGHARQRVRTMSNGMQKRVGIARALLHRPSVLLLDEPEAGLDQSSLGLLDTVVQGVARSGASVVLTTHNMEHGLALASHVLVLMDGRISLFDQAVDIRESDVIEATGLAAAQDGS